MKESIAVEHKQITDLNEVTHYLDILCAEFDSRPYVNKSLLASFFETISILKYWNMFVPVMELATFL